MARLFRAAQQTNGTDFASFQVISQRNIFDPNRVPHTRSSAARAPRVVDSFSFVGTMSYAKGNFAFFDGTSRTFARCWNWVATSPISKITTLAPKSVTLSSGTNEMVMPVGTQMRREEEGKWFLVAQAESYANQTTAATTESAAASSGEENDVLKKMMQRREQELSR